MSPNYLSDELINNIKNRFDIVDIIGQYVQLKKSGRNYLGLCPFHSEKTPSFSVSPEKQIFHCFGCGTGGDIFRFIMDIESLTFQEAVIHLGKEAGINVPDAETYSFDPNEQQKRQFLEAYDLTAKLYHYILLETVQGKEALDYLIKRGFTRELIETFSIGYSPLPKDTLKTFLTKRNFPESLLEQAGLLIKLQDGNSYDRFRNRIIFPITDVQGRVIAFGGRVLDKSLPKYLNSPETLLFNKSKTIYNLANAKKEIRNKGQAVLLEGYVDVIAVWRAGITNGIATLGTALTDEQAKLIRRHTDEVIINYDSDNAGHQATYKAIDILNKAGCKVKVLKLPDGLDPDDYITKYGPESYLEQLAGSTITATAYKLDYLKKDYSLADETDRMRYLTSALDIITDLEHAIEKEHYLKKLADEFQLSLSSLKNDLNQIIYDKRKKKENVRDNLSIKWNNIINNGNHVGKPKRLYPAYYNAEKSLISLMLKNKEIAEKVQKEIGSGFHVDDFSVLAAYLYAFYGKNNNPDVNRFITMLEDKKYVNIAAKLAILDMNEDVSDEEIADYILQIKKHNIDIEIKKLREEQLKAELNKDYAKSAQIGLEIIQLRNKLKKGKSN